MSLATGKVFAGKSFFTGEVVTDDIQKLGTGFNVGNVRAECPGSSTPLGVAACVFPHQRGSFFLAESVTHERVVMQHAVSLFEECRLCRDRIATKRCGSLCEKPRFTQRGSCNHHSIDVITADHLHNFVCGIQITSLRSRERSLGPFGRGP